MAKCELMLLVTTCCVSISTFFLSSSAIWLNHSFSLLTSKLPKKSDRLLPVRHCLPPRCALATELLELNELFRMLPLVLLSACLLREVGC